MDEGFAYGRRYMRIRRMRRDRSADADPVSVFEEGAVHGDTSDEERACERQGELLREDAEGHLTRGRRTGGHAIGRGGSGAGGF